MDSRIEDIVAREILDSRGNPTVEMEVFLVDGTAAPARQYLPAPPSVAGKQQSCAMAIRTAMAARV